MLLLVVTYNSFNFFKVYRNVPSFITNFCNLCVIFCSLMFLVKVLLFLLILSNNQLLASLTFCIISLLSISLVFVLIFIILFLLLVLGLVCYSFSIFLRWMFSVLIQVFKAINFPLSTRLAASHQCKWRSPRKKFQSTLMWRISDRGIICLLFK